MADIQESGPTQALDVPDYMADPDVAEEKPQPWGHLVSLNPKFPNVDLFDEIVLFGRGANCQVTYTDRSVSTNHLKIFRERIGSSKHECVVWLEDLSTNGTHVNNELVGKGKKKILENGHTICVLMREKGGPDNIQYVYQNIQEEQKETESGGPQARYNMMQVLGTGNFASVVLGINKETGERVAIKVIDKKKFAMSNGTKRQNALMGEVEILQTLKHPGCITIHEMFETDTKLYLVLELVTGGELFDKIVEAGHFSEEKSCDYFKQMLEAIAYLHDASIAHRDLKPENILLKSKEDDKIKLSDFGLSRVMDDASKMKTMCGTPQYVAPEVLTEGGKEGYSKACDLWSLGVILYIMLAGYPPFHESKKVPLFQQIKTAMFDFEDDAWNDISEEAKDLIRKLLVVDPEARLDVHAALAHSWIVSNGAPSKLTNADPDVDVNSAEAAIDDISEEEESNKRKKRKAAEPSKSTPDSKKRKS